MSICILVVEDEADIRKGICIELAHGQWPTGMLENRVIENGVIDRGDGVSTAVELFEADDVSAALNVLAQVPVVHAILTDIMMPSGSDAGLRLIESIRKHPQWRKIPVIVLSARTKAADILDALRLGAMDYLVKPYAPADLIERVARAAELGLALQRPRDPGADSLKRKRLVEAMKTALLYWELATQRSKVQLADESGLWRIYIDSRGTCSTKTLDKYLHLESLPANPKLHVIEKTLHYVLAHCQGHEPVRQELQALLTQFDPT